MYLQIPKLLLLTKSTTLFVCVFCLSAANAGSLNISDFPLELTPAVPPNIFILTDDSRSMDWEVLTQNDDNSAAFCAPTVDGPCNTAGITHRVPEGGVPASCEFYVDPATATASEDYVSGYLYAVRFPSDTFFPTDTSLLDDNVIENCYVAADNAFRFRNSTFNPLYFDPNQVYVPWAGVDINGNAYGDADITNAPDNPYDPQDFIDLTTDLPGLDSSGNRLTGNGFKYYVWNDANDDGVFDAGEETEFLIRDFLPGGSTPNADRITNFANWFTYYRKREYVAKALTSHAVAGNNFSRVGFATINQNTGSGLGVALLEQTFAPGSNKRALLDTLFAVDSSGETPLRSSYEEVGNYFDCAAGDIFNSTSPSSPGSVNCPVLAEPAGECQVNSTFIVTDGFNNGPDPSVGNEDGNDSTIFDGDAGDAFADGFSNTLADVAIFYYENDLQGALDDGVLLTSVDTSRDPNSPALLQAGNAIHQHLNTNIIGIFNSMGLTTAFPVDATVSEAWVDPNTTPLNFLGSIDDLRHAAYNGRGELISTLLPGTEFPAVIGEVESIFTRAASASGSTTAVAFNTQNINEETLVFRAFANLSTNSGELAAQRVNLDGSFAVDLNGDPDFVWSAATELDAQSASSRLILTYEPTSLTGREFIITSTPATSGLSDAQQEALQIPAPANPANPIVPARVGYLRGDATNEGSSFNQGDLRVRTQSTIDAVTTGGRLGDIVHSSPVFVGEPPFADRFGGAYPTTVGSTYFEFRIANTSRDELVYVGANDGMLHAFFADPLASNSGQENFAYIPNILLDEIGEFTDPNYSHRFYVDSSPSVNDVFIDPNPTTVNSFEWRTVLVNGLGAGGQGYFALDITDPGSMGTESVMWEFTDSDDADLGFTYSEPLIAMSNVGDSGSGEQQWVAIFGNGFNNTAPDAAASATGTAAIYILFIDEGYDGWGDPGDFIKIDTGVGTNADGTPNGIGGVTGIDVDDNGTVDRLYAGDLQGNVYVIDISSASTSSWGVDSTLFTASYLSTSTSPQPITTKPTVIANPSIADSFIVIVGTGSFFTTDDAISTDIQSLYGLLDSPGNNSTITKFSTPPQLVEQSLSTFVDNNFVDGTGDSLVIRTITDNPVIFNDTGSDQVRGWFIDFDIPSPGASAPDVQFPGERPIRNLQLFSGQLFFSTVIPHDGMSCSPPEGGFGLSVDPVTGGLAPGVIFDINFDGLFNAEDNLNLVDSANNVIVGTRFESAPSDTTFIGNQRVTPLSNGDVDQFFVNPDLDSGGAIGALLGRHSWKEIRQ